MAMPLRLQRYDNFGNYANNWGILCEKMGDGTPCGLLGMGRFAIGRPAGYWIWDIGDGRLDALSPHSLIASSPPRSRYRLPPWDCLYDTPADNHAAVAAAGERIIIGAALLSRQRDKSFSRQQEYRLWCARWCCLHGYGCRCAVRHCVGHGHNLSHDPAAGGFPENKENRSNANGRNL